MNLYRGDIVYTNSDKRCIVRLINENERRVLLQIGNDITWVWASDLTWRGEALDRVPMTRFGWKRLGRKVTGS